MVDYTVDYSVYVVHCTVDCTVDYSFYVVHCTIDCSVYEVHCTVDCLIDWCMVSYTYYDFSSMMVFLTYNWDQKCILQICNKILHSTTIDCHGTLKECVFHKYYFYV